MATLKRDRARKPLIADGVTYGAVRPIWIEDPENPGYSKSKEDGYMLTVNDGKDHKISYEVTLNRYEMLTAIAAWLSHEQQLARKAVLAARKSENQ